MGDTNPPKAAHAVLSATAALPTVPADFDADADLKKKKNGKFADCDNDAMLDGLGEQENLLDQLSKRMAGLKQNATNTMPEISPEMAAELRAKFAAEDDDDEEEQKGAVNLDDLEADVTHMHETQTSQNTSPNFIQHLAEMQADAAEAEDDNE